jgi:hypothetical protein
MSKIYRSVNKNLSLTFYFPILKINYQKKIYIQIYYFKKLILKINNWSTIKELI